MNTDIIESANISPGSSKEIFLLYYKELQTLIDDEIITMEELKEALKKQEMENHLVKIT